MKTAEKIEAIYDDARRAGIDLDLIDTNLALTVKQRWQQHDAALRLILKLEQAKAAHDARRAELKRVSQ